MPTAISQVVVGDMAKGKDGRLYGDHPNLVEENEPTGDNAAAQVTTIVVDTATNGQEYSYTVEGTEVSFTADGTATLAEIADGLATAHGALVLANSFMTASSNGVDTVTLTANRDGESVEVNLLDGAADMSLTATTAASNGNVLPFGVAVVRDSASGAVRVPESGDAVGDFVGVTRYTDDEASTEIGNSKAVGYPPGRDAIVLKRGRIYVEGNQASAATRASDVWVGTDAGEAGKFFTADNAGTTRIQLTAGFEWKEANVLEVFTSNL